LHLDPSLHPVPEHSLIPRIDLKIIDPDGSRGRKAAKVVEQPPSVIFTTAFDEYAIKAFETHAVDYLLKPVRFPRFLNAVQKVVKANNEKTDTADINNEDNYIFVKTESKGKLLKINLDDIEYIEGMKNYVAIYRGGQKTLVYTNLKDLILHLPAKQFIRIHKSFIIPINRITGIEGNRVVLKNVTAEILIGESYKEDLMEIIKHRMIS